MNPEEQMNQLITENLSLTTAVPSDLIYKQILVVNRFAPQLGAGQEKGKPPFEEDKITFWGSPTSGCDPKLKNAFIHFSNGILNPPYYNEITGEIHIFKSTAALINVLTMLQNSKSIFCWIGKYENLIYGDVHCFTNLD